MKDVSTKLLIEAIQLILAVVLSIILIPIVTLILPYTIYKSIRSVKVNKNDKSPYVK